MLAGRALAGGQGKQSGRAEQRAQAATAGIDAPPSGGGSLPPPAAAQRSRALADDAAALLGGWRELLRGTAGRGRRLAAANARWLAPGRRSTATLRCRRPRARAPLTTPRRVARRPTPRARGETSRAPPRHLPTHLRAVGSVQADGSPVLAPCLPPPHASPSCTRWASTHLRPVGDVQVDGRQLLQQRDHLLDDARGHACAQGAKGPAGSPGGVIAVTGTTACSTVPQGTRLRQHSERAAAVRGEVQR